MDSRDIQLKEPGTLNDYTVKSCLARNNTGILNSTLYKVGIDFYYVKVLKCWCLFVISHFFCHLSYLPNQYMPGTDIPLNNTLLSTSANGYRKMFTYEENGSTGISS